MGVDARRWTWDAALAVLLAVTGVRYALNAFGPVVQWRMAGEVLHGVVLFGTIGPVGAMFSAVLAAAPLAARRRFPLGALWVVSAATVPFLATNPDLVFVGCVVLGVAIYSAAAYSPHRLATMVSLPVAAVLLVLLFQNAALPSLPNAFVGALILLPIGVAATGIRVRRLREERRRAQLAREQAVALHDAIDQERARIARELHDVVTHHVSMMVIQAGAARSVLDAASQSPSPDARESLLAVEGAGRAALGELRGVLGLLTAGGHAELAPQPGLAEVPRLVARVREAGVPVELTVVGEPRPVPDGIGLAAYRVVQEALTNTAKHSTGASASVLVEYTVDQLRIEVVDAGGAAGRSAEGSGFGLVGLQERIAVYGGTLQAGRRLTGGYRVRAQLPLAAS